MRVTRAGVILFSIFWQVNSDPILI
uniref:Uncharacterized protein n=1 Tax=Arundo donax TaxID=35708 RepID=A0A0A9GYF5_ARUDO